MGSANSLICACRCCWMSALAPAARYLPKLLAAPGVSRRSCCRDFPGAGSEAEVTWCFKRIWAGGIAAVIAVGLRSGLTVCMCEACVNAVHTRLVQSVSL